MQFNPHLARRHHHALALTLAIALALSLTLVAGAAALVQLSSDPYTNPTSQHATEVEPDTFSFGSTIVMVIQVGRFFDGGASNIGWATSQDSGATWTNGVLPGITKFAGGSYDRVSDPSIAYDAKHNVWLASTLALTETPYVRGAGVLTSRSTDGGLTWGNPVVVTNLGDSDKNWIVCDNTPTSRYYGNCYTQWDDVSAGGRIYMSTSTNGGLTWGSRRATANRAAGLGGQPVVQPNGTVIVPISNAYETAILAFRSANGGASWTQTTRIANVQTHYVAGNLRTGPLPSAEVDGSGKVYVVWQDCRFRAGCSANDIVMSTSSNGVAWSRVTRIPLDSTTSGMDHFIPGLAVDNPHTFLSGVVDKTTRGTSTRLALTYYYYPNANCTVATCQLNVGFTSSANGGLSWSVPQQLAGPMSLGWIANTSQGAMVGDYISTSFAGGKAFPGIIVAHAPGGSVFDEALYTVAGGLARFGADTISATNESPVPNAASDHAPATVPQTAR